MQRRKHFRMKEIIIKHNNLLSIFKFDKSEKPLFTKQEEIASINKILSNENNNMMNEKNRTSNELDNTSKTENNNDLTITNDISSFFNESFDMIIGDDSNDSSYFDEFTNFLF